MDSSKALSRVLDMDDHAITGNIIFNLRNLPGCLKPKNLTVKLSIVRKVG